MNLYNGNRNGNAQQPVPEANGNGKPPTGSVAVGAQGDRNWKKNYQSAGTAFDQPVVLRQPRSWSRAIIWTLMGVTTIVVAWAFIAQTDEAVPAQGKLEPEGRVAEVQVPLSGVVKEVSIKDGDKVEQGSTLLKLDPTVPKSQETALRQVRKALTEENDYYQAQLANDPSEPVPASLSPQQVLLTQNRSALIAENQVYRLQLSGAASGGGLTPEEQARLRSGNAEIASRINTAESDMVQSQRQLAQVQAQLTGAQQLLAVDQGILNNLKELYEKGALAELQLLQQQQQVTSRQAEVNRLLQEESRLRAAIAQGGERVRNTISLAETELFTRIADNEKRIAEIDSQLSKAIVESQKRIAEIDSQLSETKQTLQYQDVKAPISGTVFDLKAKSPGFVTSTTEPVLKIVPDDALIANVFVTNKDIGFVREGMDVDVRIDSFPFSEFGDIKGKLVWIGSDALPPDEIYNFYRFPAKVKLDGQSIMAQGRSIKLQSGMSVSVNIKVRKRSVIEIFTNLFSKKADSLKQTR